MGRITCCHRAPRNTCARMPNGMLRSIQVHDISPVSTQRNCSHCSPRYIHQSMATARTSGKATLASFIISLCIFICALLRSRCKISNKMPNSSQARLEKPLAPLSAKGGGLPGRTEKESPLPQKHPLEWGRNHLRCPTGADFATPSLPFRNYSQTYAGWRFCSHSTPGSKADFAQENSPTGSADGPIARLTALR